MNMNRIFALAILIMICSNRGATKKFIVGDEATVSQKENSTEYAQVVHGCHPALDAEALRILNHVFCNIIVFKIYLKI